MGAIGRLTYAASVLLVFVAAAVFLGFLAGQPVLLSYVETGSMEPTIESGDGFVVVPAAVADDPEVGDVVVFDAEELAGGGLTTHRIVEETDRGYVTRGDANPSTDQAADEPPVSDEQIAAVAVHAGDDPITIPGVGTVIMGLRATFGSVGEVVDDSVLTHVSLPTLLFGVGGVAIALGFLFDEGQNRRQRVRTRPGYDPPTVVGVVVVVAVVAATLAMWVPAGPVKYGIASTDGPVADDPLAIPAGEEATVTHTSGNAGILPTLVVLDPGEGVTAADEAHAVAPRDTTEAEITITAPEAPGRHDRFVAEHRYLLVLPPTVLVALHEVHPVAAIAGVNLVVTAVLVLVGTVFVGRNRIAVRYRRRDLSALHRLRRRFW